ncbi:cellulase [Hypericibacter adhaerens]|uniref:Cellulase n=1 Tax=Hypericibacter adhaerens TaxID=2602016 RepID=A0A5J6MVN1_9PROT|nr:DUF2155 domain-containing protein [Hypericibacter adhaerens]QEX21499.1 cellulase [Hypericibacter adhaerens]
MKPGPFRDWSAALRRGLAPLSILAAGMPALLAAAPAGADPFPVAVLRTLDKVTARVATIEVPVGSATELGSLEVTVRACDKRPPEETPESAAFLEIVETKTGEPSKTVFSGWMFASSPALSALEHPIYDIWVVDCVKPATSESGTTP